MTDTELATLPAALQQLLIEVRKKIRDTQAERVTVEMGWPEVRGVYALFTALNTARRSRDEHKKKLRVQQRMREELQNTVEHRSAANLIDNESVLALLGTVEKILDGTLQSNAVVSDTLDEVIRLLNRTDPSRHRRRPLRRGRRKATSTASAS